MKSTRKLLFSVMALIVALSASVTATFAWFTSGNKATVDSFNVEMTTKQAALAIGVETTNTNGIVKYSNKISAVDLFNSRDMFYDSTANNIYNTARVYIEAENAASYTLATAASGEVKYKTISVAADSADAENHYSLSGTTYTKQDNYASGQYTITATDITSATKLYRDEGAYASFTADIQTEAKYALYVEGAQFKMDATTTTEDTSNNVFTAFKKTTDVGVFTTTAVAGVDYLNFRIYFKSDSTSAKDVVLAQIGSAITSVTDGDKDDKNITVWADLAETVYGHALTKGEKINDYAAYAMRVGFNGYTGTGDGIVTESTYTATANKKVNVWDPYKTANYYNVFGVSTANPSYYLNNLATDYYNQFYSLSLTPAAMTAELVTDLTDGTGTAPVEGTTVITKLVNQTINTTKVTTGETATQGYVEINIWAEGWDGDCFNSILSDIFSVQLAFLAY